MMKRFYFILLSVGLLLLTMSCRNADLDIEQISIEKKVDSLKTPKLMISPLGEGTPPPKDKIEWKY